MTESEKHHFYSADASFLKNIISILPGANLEARFTKFVCVIQIVIQVFSFYVVYSRNLSWLFQNPVITFDLDLLSQVFI